MSLNYDIVWYNFNILPYGYVRLLQMYKAHAKLHLFLEHHQNLTWNQIQSKLPIRSPLFSVTLQSAVSSGSPRTISNANAPLFSTHLSNAVNAQQKLSQIAKFSLSAAMFFFFFLLRSILFVSESVSRLRCAATKIMVSGKTITRNWRKFFIFYLVDEWSTACGYRFHSKKIVVKAVTSKGL